MACQGFAGANDKYVYVSIYCHILHVYQYTLIDMQYSIDILDRLTDKDIFLTLAVHSFSRTYFLFSKYLTVSSVIFSINTLYLQL